MLSRVAFAMLLTGVVACSEDGADPNVSPDLDSSGTTGATTSGSGTSSAPPSTQTTTSSTSSAPAQTSTGAQTTSTGASSATSSASSQTGASSEGLTSDTSSGSSSGANSDDGSDSSGSSDSASSDSDTSTTDSSSSAGNEYQPCPATGPCVIMPYGDSITEGFPIWGGYRIELFRKAIAAGKDITFVGSAENGPNDVDGTPFPKKHEGHGAHTIQDGGGNNGIFKFAAPSISQYKPHIITLMIGTNDLNGNVDVNNAPNRLSQLLDEIYENAPEILVILAQIVPGRNDGLNAKVTAYNASFPTLVDTHVAQGRHLILIDMNEAFTRDANYKTALLGDDLHPNEAGYARMGQVWFEALSPYLP